MDLKSATGIQYKQLLKFKTEHLDSAEAHAITERLTDLGIYPGVYVDVVQTIPFSQVTVIRFHQTLVALNKEEFQCLQF